MKKIYCAVLFSMTLFIASPAICQNAAAMPTPKEQCENNGVNFENAQNFVIQLKKAIRNNNKDKMAEMISYPLRINKMDDEKSFYLKNSDQFLKKYSQLFNNKMKKAVADDNGPLFCNYQGAMIAGGWIWFTPIDDGSLKIISIVQTEPDETDE